MLTAPLDSVDHVVTNNDLAIAAEHCEVTALKGHLLLSKGVWVESVVYPANKTGSGSLVIAECGAVLQMLHDDLKQSPNRRLEQSQQVH